MDSSLDSQLDTVVLQLKSQLSSIALENNGLLVNWLESVLPFTLLPLREFWQRLSFAAGSWWCVLTFIFFIAHYFSPHPPLFHITSHQ